MAGRGVARESVKLIGGTLIGRVSGLLRGFLVPAALLPAQFGVWQVVQVIWQVGLFLHLGSFAFLNRELPVHAAGDAWDRARPMRRAGFWGSLAVAVVVAVVFALWPGEPVSRLRDQGDGLMVLCGAGLILQLIVSYHGVVFRSRSWFGRASLLVAGVSVLSLPFAVAGAHLAGAVGVVAGMVAAFGVMALVGFFWNPLERPHAGGREYLRMCAAGAPLSLLALLTTATTAVGPVVSASLFGFEQTGLFGIGLLMASAASLVPQSIGAVLYPRYLVTMARTRDPVAVGVIARKALRVASFVAPLAVLSFVVSLEALLQWVLPRYLPGLGCAYWLVASAYFLSIGASLLHPIQAIRRHRAMAFVQALGLLLAIVAAVVGGTVWRGIEGVAGGVFVSISSSTVLAVCLLIRWTQAPGKSIGQEVVRVFAPALVLSAVAGVAMLIPVDGDDPGPVILGVLGRLGVLAIGAGLTALFAFRGAIRPRA